MNSKIKCLGIIFVYMLIMTGCGEKVDERISVQYQMIKDDDEKESFSDQELPSLPTADPEPIDSDHVIAIGDTATNSAFGSEISITIDKCELTKDYLGERYTDNEAQWLDGIEMDNNQALLGQYSYVWVFETVKNTGTETMEWAPGSEKIVSINEDNYLSQFYDLTCGQAFYTNGQGDIDGDRHQLYEELVPGDERKYLIGYIVSDNDIEGLGYYVGYSACENPNPGDWVIRLGD